MLKNINEIIDSIRAGEPKARIAAMYSLFGCEGHLRMHPNANLALSVLKSIIHTEDLKIAVCAAYILLSLQAQLGGNLNDDDVNRVLLEGLNDPELWYWATFGIALAGIQSKEAIEVLLKHVQDPDSQGAAGGILMLYAQKDKAALEAWLSLHSHL